MWILFTAFIAGPCGAKADDVIKVAAGGPSSFAYFKKKIPDLEKLGMKIELTQSRNDLALGAVGEGLVDAAVGASVEDCVKQAKSKTGTVLDSALFKDRMVKENKLRLGVHPSNKVKSLSTEQITKMLKGEIKNWKQVGGADAPIRLLVAKAYLTIQKMISSFFLKDAPLPEGVQYVVNADGLVRSLKEDPNAVGFFSSTPTVDGFTPKYLETEAKVASFVAVKKDPKPQVAKMFKFFENRQPDLNEE